MGGNVKGEQGQQKEGGGGEWNEGRKRGGGEVSLCVYIAH